jgi:hypothetical protein
LGGELTSDNIRKAQSKVLKNLKKDPAYYTNKIAEETVKTFGEYGSGKKSGKYSTNKDAEAVKAEVKTPKDETPKKDKANELKSVGKVEKSNISKDKKPTMAKKPKEMTQTPKKAKGIKKIMEMPGKEKKINLKENKESQDVSPEQRQKLEKVISSWRQSGKNDMADALERLLKSKPIELNENIASYPMDHEWVNKHYVMKSSEKRPVYIVDKETGEEVTMNDVVTRWESEKNINELDFNQKLVADIDPNHYLTKKASDYWDNQDDKEFKRLMLSRDPMNAKITQSLKNQVTGGKIKLTKEVVGMIQEMVSEAVAMVKSKSGTDAIDYKNPQELNALKSDPNITSIKTTTGQKVK